MTKAEITGADATIDAKSRKHLERLYRLHSPWVTARIRRRFGWDAEDVVQEAWIRLIPISAGELIRSPKALLLRVASNIAISRVRQSRRRAEILVTSSARDAPRYGAEQVEAIFLRQVVLGLPEPLRDVFVLSRFGGLTNSQIADQLDIKLKTVEWRMTKALAHCAAQLQR